MMKQFFLCLIYGLFMGFLSSTSDLGFRATIFFVIMWMFCELITQISKVKQHKKVFERYRKVCQYATQKHADGSLCFNINELIEMAEKAIKEGEG